MNSKQMAGTLAASLVLLCCMAAPAFAEEIPAEGGADTGNITIYQIEDTAPFAAPAGQVSGNEPVLKDVRTVEQGTQTLLVKTWEVPPRYDAGLLVEEDFEKGGMMYTKAYLLQTAENYDSQTKLASETVTITHEKKDEAAARLQPILEYDQDGFTGQLTLQTGAIHTEAADKSSYSYAVADTREFTGLERNDAYNIPKTVDKNGVQLQLVDVNWSQRLEGGYDATASYRGTASGTTVSNYITTASYIGEVSKDTLESITYAVAYEGTPIPLPSPNYLPYILAGVGMAALLAVLAVLWNKRNNTKVYAMVGREYQLVHRQRVSVLSPIVDLTPQEISSGSEEFMIVMDRMAARKLRGQFIKVVGKDGRIKERRIFKTRYFHITPNQNIDKEIDYEHQS